MDRAATPTRLPHGKALAVEMLGRDAKSTRVFPSLTAVATVTQRRLEPCAAGHQAQEKDTVIVEVDESSTASPSSPQIPKQKPKKRSKAASQKRLQVASEKRKLEKQKLLLEPESLEADAIRKKRRGRALAQGMKRAAKNRDASSTRAVGSQVPTPRSGKVSWLFEDRVQALIKYPEELFRVQPTVYGASKSTPCTFEAFSRLRQGRWFTDETINYYFAALGHRCREPEQIAIVSTFFYNTLKEHGEGCQRVRRFGRPVGEKETNSPGLLRGSLLLIPVNWESSHWGLVSVHPFQQKVKIWDSLRSSGMPDSPEMRRLISAWIKREQGWRDQPHNPIEWKWEVPSVPQQKNTDDCGVYLCSFASALVRQTSIEVVDESSANRFRAEMQYSALLAATGHRI